MNLPAPVPKQLPYLLIWDGKEGLIRLPGVELLLTQAPKVFPDPQPREFRYVASLRYAEIRESAQPWRPMTRAERVSCDWFLGKIEASVKSLLECSPH